MIQCPNCGMENAPTRAFCAVCGEKLTAPEPERLPAPTEPGNALDLDWLLADDEPPAQPDAPATTPPPADNSADEAPEMTWLLQSLTGEPDSPPAPEPGTPAPPAEPPAPTPPPVNLNLPAWLQGAELTPEPLPSQRGPEWDSDVDFSDLPDWELDEERPDADDPTPLPTLAKPFSADDPIQAAETEGTGLLTGVRGPIPIEPIITISHDVPEMPGRGDPSRNSEAANLFARIAGGAVVPEPLAAPKAPPRGAEFFYLLLLIAITLAFFVNLPFGQPPQTPAALAFARTIESVPANRTVLLAFDYEASLSDELDPAAIATLTHLRRVAAPDNGAPRPLSLLAVSTSPQGTALATRAWAASRGPESARWEVMPYLSGGSLALRALLQSRLSPTLAPEQDRIALIIVLGDETADVQRWLEQVGSQISDVPMLAIAPAAAETTLMPYLVAGQLDGLLAGIPGTASYEFHGMGDDTLIAWKRLDALTVAALLVLLVILAGNLVAVGRGRQERQGPAAASPPDRSSPPPERRAASERRTSLASLANRQRRK